MTVDRKAIKRQYKESYRPTGIYRVTNRESGKILIGSSVNLPATRNKLAMQLDNGSYLMVPELQSDWKRLGREAFDFDVVAELEAPREPGWDPSDDLAALLTLWLEELEPYGERGYNRRPRSEDR